MEDTGSGIDWIMDSDVITIPVSDEADSEITGQAAYLEQMLPNLLRSIVGTPADHPLAELPIAQLRLCTLLLRDGRRTMSQISDEIGISVSAVTQMADRLERVGMVERMAEADGDRRTRHLQLTERGAALMESRQKWRVGRASRVLVMMTSEERAQVFAALNKLQEYSRAVPPNLVPLELPF